jgi:hypothetical protein
VNPPAPRAPSDVGLLGATGAAVDCLAEAALDVILRALQRRPDLVNAFQQLLGSRSQTTALAAAFMSVTQYAVYRCVSDRTIRYDLQKMEEGKHFHLAGRRGGRVVIHVQEADAWYKERSTERAGARSIEMLAVDEVTRRRARVALKKRKDK